jgi:hypothetical protein
MSAGPLGPESGSRFQMLASPTGLEPVFSA